MKPFTNPYFHDPMFNASFSELGFEYDKNGAILTPWSNQFPNPIKYSTKRDICLFRRGIIAKLACNHWVI